MFLRLQHFYRCYLSSVDEEKDFRDIFFVWFYADAFVI